jgi:FtsP/CotA-like multicopper oxidase with cupredoxin domain
MRPLTFVRSRRWGTLRAFVKWAAALLALLMLAGACGGGEDPAAQNAATPPSAEAGGGPGPSDKERQEHEDHEEEDGDEVAVRVRVAGGEVTGVGDAVDVRIGQQVVIRASADVADHIHVHGYDELADLEPGEVTALRFTADIPGAFEVELEEAGLQLFELRVQ